MSILGAVPALALVIRLFRIPAAPILDQRLQQDPPTLLFSAAGWVALAIIVVSLVFNTVDRIRRRAGTRTPRGPRGGPGGRLRTVTRR